MSAKPAPRGCVLRALWLYVCFVLGTAGVALALGYLLSSRRWRAEDAAWAARGTPMGSFAAQHPITPDNAAALRLDELTRPIGIECIPGYPVPEHRAVDMGKDPVLSAVRAYVPSLAALRADGPIPAAPAEVRAYLRERAAALDAIEAHLIHEGPLVFQEDVNKGVAGPMPSLLGFRTLAQLLVIRSLEAVARGDNARAARSLEACWKYSQAFGPRADLLSHLIAIVVSSDRNAVLRLWPQAPAIWMDRVKADDFRPRVLASYQAEVYGWRAFAVRYKGAGDLSELEGSPPREDTAFQHAFRFVSVPYVRLSFAGISEVIRQSADDLVKGDPCVFDPDESTARIKALFPRWNIVGAIAAPAPIAAWISVRDAMLDNEMTLAVMDARREWPKASLPVRRSELCVGYTWAFEPSDDGGLTIRLRPTEMPHPRKDPWTFVLAPSH